MLKTRIYQWIALPPAIALAIWAGLDGSAQARRNNPPPATPQATPTPQVNRAGLRTNQAQPGRGGARNAPRQSVQRQQPQAAARPTPKPTPKPTPNPMAWAAGLAFKGIITGEGEPEAMIEVDGRLQQVRVGDTIDRPGFTVVAVRRIDVTGQTIVIEDGKGHKATLLEPPPATARPVANTGTRPNTPPVQQGRRGNGR